MERITLTKQEARRFLLAHQHLWPPYALEGKSGIVQYIRHVGCIQFDPLNIVGHNHDLTLQARIADFRPAMMQELLYADRQLLDGWDKNMSIYHVEDWPYFQRYREQNRKQPRRSGEQVEAALHAVRRALEERGPLSSLDLEMNQTVDWWWAPTTLARAALESMYLWGELVIHHKVHTRRVYDFASRHLPQELLTADDPNETDEQFYEWYALRRIGSLGLLWNKSGDGWLGISDFKSAKRQAALTSLLKQGKIIEAQVDGINTPLYLRRSDLAFLHAVQDAEETPPRAAILAPLDNLLWERRLLEAIFDFRYRWEVYKPVHEREYGYYVLPVLHGDRFVARFEPGRDKEGGVLQIKQWWWEPGIEPNEPLQAELHRCVQRFLRYLDCETIEIDRNVAQNAHIEWLAAP